MFEFKIINKINHASYYENNIGSYEKLVQDVDKIYWLQNNNKVNSYEYKIVTEILVIKNELTTKTYYNE